MKRQLVLVAAVMVLGACASTQKAWTTQDSWYKPEPKGTLDPHTTVNVPFAEVRREALPEAMQRLADVPYVEISSADAARLGEYQVSDDPNMKFFLVRAVYVNHASGHFSVLANGNTIVVSQGSFARTAHPMGRSALVIALPAAPATVYVTTWVAD